MKAIFSKDIEVRGDLEKPKRNITFSVKASDEPQSFPKWVLEQAERRGAAKIQPLKKAKPKKAEPTDTDE